MKYVKKTIVLLIGVVILSLGASILITANLGSDAVTVLNQGVSILLNIKIGYAVIINNSILFILMLIFNRKQINIGTIASAVLMGPLIDLFLLAMPNNYSDLLIINFLFSLLGLLVASIGLSIYIYSKSGLGPFEGVVDLISNKINLKFGYTKIILDFLFFLIGYLLGGTFGVISILSVIVIGPLINLFLRLLNLTNFIPSDEVKEKNIVPDDK